MTAPEWRDCADPDELAAAVADAVEVLAMGRAGDFPTANQTADQFAGSLRAGITYRIPTSWSPEPPAPDDLAARARRHADGHPESRDLIEELLGAVECTPSPDLVGLADGNEHPVTIPPDGVLRDTDPGLIRQLHDMADRWGARGVMETGATLWPDAPPPTPTPPWPGAVLSGLCDEDGVPTWLAQAGDVRGEQVRAAFASRWDPADWVADSCWVEVRAPRAVPEPETERVEPVTVRFYEAFGPTDLTVGRGPRKSMGVYPTEQEAWDSINDLPGVQGTHPSKGNTYPLRSREYEDCGPVLTWQRYREVVGRSGDYYVVERQVVGTPQATP